MEMSLEQIREALPAYAADTKLNLQTVMQSTVLTPAQAWGVAVASAAAARNPQLRDAAIAGAHATLGAAASAVVEDALAAATLMAMNNVYYRFRHLVGKEVYSSKPARLRMNRMAKVATSKADFELFSLAVSAINNCETCVRSHEKVVTEHHLSEDAVHDAVRIAATFNAAALAAELPTAPAAAAAA
jgi:alkyl hydroperoxide reductase subunit D